MTMFTNFFCLCPFGITTKLNFNISRAAYYPTTNYLIQTENKLRLQILIPIIKEYCRRNLLIFRRCNYKQLLYEVFVISGIIKGEVSVISRSRRLMLITLTETLIISDITKTESNNCFIIHCFKANNDKRIIAPNTVVYFLHAVFLLRCP